MWSMGLLSYDTNQHPSKKGTCPIQPTRDYLYVNVKTGLLKDGLSIMMVGSTLMKNPVNIYALVKIRLPYLKKNNWLHLLHFSPLRVFKSVLKALALSQWLHSLDLSPIYVFSNASPKRLHKRMQNHIGCICLTFVQCVFSNVSSNANCVLEQSCDEAPL